MIRTIIFSLAISLSPTFAFFWDNNGPFGGIQDQLFGKDGPMFVYQQSNSRFSGGNNGFDEAGQNTQQPALASNNVEVASAPQSMAMTPQSMAMAPMQPSAQLAPGQVVNAPAPSYTPHNAQASALYRSQFVRSPQYGGGFAPMNSLGLGQALAPPLAFQMPPPMPMDPFMKPNNFLGANTPLQGQPVYGPIPAPLAPGQCLPDFLCCSNSVFYRNKFKLLQCCGEVSFDQRYEQCHNGVVAPLSQGMPTLAPAERLFTIECGGHSYLAPQIYDCCNGTFFDKTKFYCSNPETTTQVVTTDATTSEVEAAALPKLKSVGESRPNIDSEVKPATSERAAAKSSEDSHHEYMVCEIYRYKVTLRALRTYGCCGEKIFNFKKENCTSGEIQYRQSATNQRPLPQGELLVFCPGGVQHWVAPSKLKQTRCCGPELCPVATVAALDSSRDAVTQPAPSSSQSVTN